MELYDEELEQKKSKVPMILGISIIILLLLTALIVYGIIYLKNSITTIKIDGKINTEIEKIFYIEETEQGLELYMPIIKAAKFFGYEGFSGDYKDKSEDKTKCHMIGENETALFTKDSDTLIKINKNLEYEYIELDKPVFEKDGELYASMNGIQQGFNVLIESDKKIKNVNIYNMNTLVKAYADKFQLENYSNAFTDQKAIFQSMMIIQENGSYGVIEIENGKKVPVLESKYEEIRYLPSTIDFLVKSNGKYGVVNEDSTVKLRTVYDEIRILDNKYGLYLVKQNNVYGVVNTNGDIIIEPEYKQIGINIDKYVQNGVKSQYILLDEVIPAQNEENLWGLFSLKGEKITEFKYSGIGCKSAPESNSHPALVIPSYKIIVVSNDKYYNLITTSGEELISANILDSVYFKTDATTGENKFYMTSANNTKRISIEEWLTSIGR